MILAELLVYGSGLVAALAGAYIGHRSNDKPRPREELPGHWSPEKLAAVEAEVLESVDDVIARIDRELETPEERAAREAKDRPTEADKAADFRRALGAGITAGKAAARLRLVGYASGGVISPRERRASFAVAPAYARLGFMEGIRACPDCETEDLVSFGGERVRTVVEPCARHLASVRALADSGRSRANTV